MTVKFNRVAAAFEEAARRQRPLPCESSGSEYWPEEEEEEVGESHEDLFDLINSFIYGDDGDCNQSAAHHVNPHQDDDNEEYEDEAMERKEEDDSDHQQLKRLLAGDDSGDGGELVVDRIRYEVEVGCRLIGETSIDSRNGFKRRLMTYLREQGYDAGLCKSRWERTARYPAGDYEYIDVTLAGKRHIVEVNLAEQFQIACPTRRYATLIGALPPIFIGQLETLKLLVSLMTVSMKLSLKTVALHVAPWRRSGYMQAKWFGSYKRTINAVSGKMAGILDDASLARKRSMGFEFGALPVRNYCCRDDFGRKVGYRVGLLTAAFQRKL